MTIPPPIDEMYIIVCYVKDSKRATYASMITAPLFKELAECMILHEQTKNMSL